MGEAFRFRKSLYDSVLEKWTMLAWNEHMIGNVIYFYDYLGFLHEIFR